MANKKAQLESQAQKKSDSKPDYTTFSLKAAEPFNLICRWRFS